MWYVYICNYFMFTFIFHRKHFDFWAKFFSIFRVIRLLLKMSIQIFVNINKPHHQVWKTNRKEYIKKVYVYVSFCRARKIWLPDAHRQNGISKLTHFMETNSKAYILYHRFYGSTFLYTVAFFRKINTISNIVFSE